ncbi:MAG: phenylalanine--tRNA ligase subunit beta [Treponema sp.]|nr:phenylalanine--tRNA ligase subunit beta [Treponema sp.]
MPKIEVNESVFYALASPDGRNQYWTSKDAFEEALSCAKAELDEDSDKSLPESERVLKIELNDTNRPDLWGTAGCARQLRVYYGGTKNEYSFFSRSGNVQKARHKVKAEKSVQQVRPYIAGFIASGKAISDPALRDIIQTQEKLAWNFGRKRRTVSMGVYRIAKINWPIVYKGVDPDSVSFVPLQGPDHGLTPGKDGLTLGKDQAQPFGSLTLREILKQHPKGKEFAFIQEHEPIHPLLADSQNNILSYPPIINSADLGAVQVGDTDIFVELTGTDIALVTLATSIIACDLADNGFTIEPVEIEYEFDTPFGRNIVYPYYFQEPVFCSLARIERFLGEKLNADECVQALNRMGVKAEATMSVERGANTEGATAGVNTEGVLAWPPEYRNDFLHAADVAEDVMIGRGLGSFKPERPSDSTIGRLSPITFFSRQVKEIFIGLGYQEMIYNYLGSRKDLVENMRGEGTNIIRIANPMTENYEYVRDSIIASLMISESVSGHSVYPHKIFEVGKIAYKDKDDNYGALTRQYAGFLHADKEANFNTAAAQLQTLFYYLSREYDVEELASFGGEDPRFIPGRAAAIVYKGKKIGVFGEIHPEALENWGITVPCTAGEFDLDALMG